MAKKKTIEPAATLAALAPVPTDEQLAIYKKIKLTVWIRSGLRTELYRQVRRVEEKALEAIQVELWDRVCVERFGADWAVYCKLDVGLRRQSSYLYVSLGSMGGQVQLNCSNGRVAPWESNVVIQARSEVGIAVKAFDERKIKFEETSSEMSDNLVGALKGCRTLYDFVALVPDAFEVLGHDVLMQIAPPPPGITGALVVVSHHKLRCMIGGLMGVQREGCDQVTA